ncbi:MAG: aromatic ring-hydroxylating oxygenase subunit alpha [Gammaproteobacteria bacterium]
MQNIRTKDGALSARCYTAPDIYELERERIMARTWQFAGHAAPLKKAGDYFVFEAAGENCFCVRGEDGGTRAFYNVCRHRAHELLRGAGNVRRIICPYHSWAYELNGNFRSAPNIRAAENFCKKSARLKEIRAEIFHGFVFVNMDDDAAPMDEWFPGAREELAEFAPNLESLAPTRWVEIPENCNWKVSAENYNECYHCARNHPAFSAGVVKPETYDIRPRGFCLRHTTECRPPDEMSYPINLDSHPHAGEYSSWFLWPAFSFQVYPGGVLNTYHWRPRGAERVVVWRGWYTPGGEESEIIDALAKQDRETTVAEDILLVESVQRGLNSRGYETGQLVIDAKGGVNSEHSVREFRKWVADALAD